MSQPTIADKLRIGLGHHRFGIFALAEQVYREILAIDPDQPDALHLLGLTAGETGRNELAVELIERSLAIRPDWPEGLFNFGSALEKLGRTDEAVAAYQRSIALRPGYAESLNNLGRVLLSGGQPEMAIDAFDRAIASRPDLAEAHCNRGEALNSRGRHAEAADASGTAISLRPTYARAFGNLALALSQTGSANAAIDAGRRAVELDPDLYEAWVNLGVALFTAGQTGQAIEAYRKAIALRGDRAEPHCYLGAAFNDAARYDESIVECRVAITLRPDFAAAHYNLGFALSAVGDWASAVAAYRRAVELNPDHPGNRSSLIFAARCNPAVGPAQIAAEEKIWDIEHAQPLRDRRPHANDPDPDRRLRIGYVSADLRDHPVGRFLIPLLAGHDPTQVEVFVYARTPAPNAVTETIHNFVDHWREIAALSDSDAAELIRTDRIDILVDLGMHSAHNRLLVFARKPAPVQATWLAYPGSTGLTAIDWRLTDSYLDPPGFADSYCSEKTIVLPHTFGCYDPLESAGIPVGPLPSLSAGVVTFGCLNYPRKLSDPLLDAWGLIMRQTAGSRLLLKAGADSFRHRVTDRLARVGIDKFRIGYAGHLPRDDYMHLHDRLDITLDSFPYSGHTTTCESLWMGVPVVSLVGPNGVGRGGLSVLSNVGLPELAVGSVEQYVATAVALAADRPRLADLRASLRGMMERSPVMDGPGFAQDFEAAFRKMWRDWCLNFPPTKGAADGPA